MKEKLLKNYLIKRKRFGIMKMSFDLLLNLMKMSLSLNITAVL